MMRIALLVACAGLATPALAQQYVATNLTPAGWLEGFFAGAGGTQAVGQGSFAIANPEFPDARTTHAFLWDQATATTVDLHPSESFSASYALNARGGQQVGYGFTSGPNIPLLWSGTAASAVLLNTDGTESAVAYDIEGGLIVGAAITPDSLGSSFAWAWTSPTAPGVSFHPPAFASSTPLAIRGGRIVGVGEDQDFLFAGIYWASVNTPGVMVRPTGYDEVILSDIAGDIIFGEGSGAASGGPRHALLFNVNDLENPVDIHPNLPDYRASFSRAMLPPNAAYPNGIQVGVAAYEDIPGSGETFERAVAWFGSASTFVDLHLALPSGNGLRFSRATGVDDAGNIYGDAYDGNGVYWAVRWSPVTPSTCGTADFDADGDSGTDADIESFFACLAGNCCTTCFGADFDGDGDTGTDADIEAFFRVLAGQPC